MSDDRLKLAALDAEDLAVLSAHAQDAVLTVGDMTYLPGDRRFAAVVNRFDWVHSRQHGRGPYRRRRAGLSFDRVSDVKLRSIRIGLSDAVVSLLAIEFEEGEAPGGWITLVFSGGGSIRLTVECIEARLSDLGPQWETSSLPMHDPEGAAASSDGAE